MTLPELLVALAIFALAVLVSMPIVLDAIRSMRGRTVVRELVITLDAARMSAVKTSRSVEVRVYPDSYEYRRGSMIRREPLPQGIRVVSSTSPIVFQPNGGVPGGASTVIEVDRGRHEPEVWDIETSPLGKAKATRRTAEGSS